MPDLLKHYGRTSGESIPQFSNLIYNVRNSTVAERLDHFDVFNQSGYYCVSSINSNDSSTLIVFCSCLSVVDNVIEPQGIFYCEYNKEGYHPSSTYMFPMLSRISEVETKWKFLEKKFGISGTVRYKGWDKVIPEINQSASSRLLEYQFSKLLSVFNLIKAPDVKVHVVNFLKKDGQYHISIEMIKEPELKTGPRQWRDGTPARLCEETTIYRRLIFGPFRDVNSMERMIKAECSSVFGIDSFKCPSSDFESSGYEVISSFKTMFYHFGSLVEDCLINGVSLFHYDVLDIYNKCWEDL